MRKIMVLLVILLSACVNTNPIIIGFSNSLTGVSSNYGTEIMYGAEMAVREINENGGIKGRLVELNIKDDKKNPLEAVRVDNELIEEGAVAVIGHALSKVSDLAIKNANENDFLLISPTISTSQVTGIKDNFIRVVSDTTTEGAKLCSLLTEQGVMSATIVTEALNIAYTESVYENLSTCLDGISGFQYDKTSFNSGQLADYEKVVTFIAESNKEVIVMIAPSNDIIDIDHFMQSEGISKDIYISHWGTSTDVLNLSISKDASIRGVNYYYLNSTSPSFIELAENYKETYGKDISFSVLYGYEAVMMLADALKNAESFNTSDLIEYITNREFQGVIDTFYINEFGDSEREIYGLDLIDGKFEYIH